jgi:hypothetical protein
MLRTLILTPFVLLLFPVASIQAQSINGIPSYTPYTGSSYGLYQGRFVRTYTAPNYPRSLVYFLAPSPVFTLGNPTPSATQPWIAPAYGQPHNMNYFMGQPSTTSVYVQPYTINPFTGQPSTSSVYVQPYTSNPFTGQPTTGPISVQPTETSGTVQPPPAQEAAPAIPANPVPPS